MLPGEGVEVVVVVEVVLGVELPPPEEDEGVDRDVLGTTTVTVTLGVVLVTCVEPGLDLLGVVDPGFDGVVDVPGVVPGWKAAYCTVPAGAE